MSSALSTATGASVGALIGAAVSVPLSGGATLPIAAVAIASGSTGAVWGYIHHRRQAQVGTGEDDSVTWSNPKEP